MVNEFRNDLQDLICKYCMRFSKSKHPNSIGCAFRCIDNSYCDFNNSYSCIITYLVLKHYEEEDY